MGTRKDKAKSLRVRVLAEGERPYAEVSFAVDNDEAVIVKRRETDFVFSLDTSNYFDGMTPDGAEVIFEGVPEKVGGFITIRDFDVEIDKTYAYFVISYRSLDEYLGPEAVKVRDPYIFWSFERINAKIASLCELPGVESVTVGETLGHKPLVAVSAGRTDNAVAIFGAVHAGEAGAELCLSVFENIVRDYPHLLEKAGVVVLPSVNADERERVVEGNPWYLRTNRNGIDINRNFDAYWETVSEGYGVSTANPRSSTYRGPYPESEPETRAVASVLERFRPAVSLSYHHVSSITGDSMYCPRRVQEDEEFNARAERIARLYKEGFREPIGYPMNKILVYSGGPGEFPDYCYKNGLLGFDIEHWASGLPMFAESHGDNSTREMLDLCIKCHTSALARLLENL